MKKIKKIAGKRKEKENREKRKENEKSYYRRFETRTAGSSAATGCLTKNHRLGTHVSPGRALVARPGAPPGDTRLNRKRKEKKRKWKKLLPAVL